MIKEAYCSKEIYKLLREKGFEGEIHTSYDKDGYTTPVITHQVATAWLRETHGIYIVFFHTNKSGWWYNITDMRDSYVFYSSEKMMCSYEEACEAAIKYSLKNLI